MRLHEEFEALISGGAIERDGAQSAVVDRLAKLQTDLAQYAGDKGGIWRSFFKGERDVAPRGLYVHGGVGRGKTMLMDLFFSTTAFEPKRRVHFHTFMRDVHAAIADARKSVSGDPIPYVAEDIARDALLLCFDEFVVEDIADAMILSRLFEWLFTNGVVVVATSNVMPDDLYQSGLNRALFLPFIKLMHANMDVMYLDAAKDYRLERLSDTPLYFTPLGPEATVGVDATWNRLTSGGREQSMTLRVQGRDLNVPRYALGVARFSFDELCRQPLAASDYIALSEHFHTLVVTDVPELGGHIRNETRRFINLVDVLYDRGAKLVVSAAAEPDALYTQGKDAFVFERTASRLQEMRSGDYLASSKKWREGSRTKVGDLK